MAGIVARTESSVESLQNGGFPEGRGTACRLTTWESGWTGTIETVGEGSMTVGYPWVPVGVGRYTASVWTERIGESVVVVVVVVVVAVAGDGWCHAIEADKFVDRELDFEWVGDVRDDAGDEQKEGESEGQALQSTWAPTDAGAGADMVIGLSCRTKIRLGNGEVAEEVEMASLHIHLGTKRATLRLGAD